MSRYVALLRGINVGGHRVKMTRLRELFQEMGFEDVETFIASGNVIFSLPGEGKSAGGVIPDPPALERRIADHLGRSLGWAVPTFIRTLPELRAVVEDGPFAGDRVEEGVSVYLIFLSDELDGDLRAAFADAATANDAFECRGREVHWRIRGKLSESTVFRSGLDRVVRNVPNTVRNLTSVERLLTKHAED